MSIKSIYKIRNRTTGQYLLRLKGGTSVTWHLKGKWFADLGRLRATITYARKHGQSVAEWEIVEYIVQECGHEPAAAYTPKRF